jgi:hypothetical protein
MALCCAKTQTAFVCLTVQFCRKRPVSTVFLWRFNPVILEEWEGRGARRCWGRNWPGSDSTDRSRSGERSSKRHCSQEHRSQSSRGNALPVLLGSAANVTATRFFSAQPGPAEAAPVGAFFASNKQMEVLAAGPAVVVAMKSSKEPGEFTQAFSLQLESESKNMEIANPALGGPGVVEEPFFWDPKKLTTATEIVQGPQPHVLSPDPFKSNNGGPTRGIPTQPNLPTVVPLATVPTENTHVRSVSIEVAVLLVVVLVLFLNLEALVIILLWR